MRTLWGGNAESIAQLAQGRRVHLTPQGISELMFGQKVAFFEVFCGQMHLTIGVRAMGLCAPDGVDKLYPIGGRPWDLTRGPDQGKCQELLDALDPWITHFAPPCTQLCIIGSRPSPGSDKFEEGFATMKFSVDQIRRRCRKGCEGSLESPSALVPGGSRSL